MPYHDEEYPGQPLWQSVLLFFCKGMIEGIIVILFLWLLVQVLFTKQLEAHLQILLLVGLIVFCLSLVLGCILCWRDSQLFAVKPKSPASPAPAEAGIFTEACITSGAITGSKHQNLQQDEDVMELTTSFTNTLISKEEFPAEGFSKQDAACEQKKLQKSYFSLRRLSSSLQTSLLYEPIDSIDNSILPLPKPSLLARTCNLLQRRCTVMGIKMPYDEHSRLTSPNVVSGKESPIPMTPLSYGSTASCKQPGSTKPCLHFTMTFSPEHQTLAVTITNFTGISHTLQDVYVLGSLSPLHPQPMQALVHNHLGSEIQCLGLMFTVSSVEELQKCGLRIAVYAREVQNQRSISLGEVEADCGGRDWKPDIPIYVTKELSMKKEKAQISQDVLVCKGISCPAKIFISLHYHNLEHCIKATVIRGENLSSLAPTSAKADYQVVVNLHHDGDLISSRETQTELSMMWNTSFTFDLPEGDINQLTLMLEFEIVQKLCPSESQVIGRVLIGADAADAGRAHWRDVCNLLVEQPWWHIVQPELL